MSAILGKKLGMTQLFPEDGRVDAASPCSRPAPAR